MEHQETSNFSNKKFDLLFNFMPRKRVKINDHK